MLPEHAWYWFEGLGKDQVVLDRPNGRLVELIILAFQNEPRILFCFRAIGVFKHPSGLFLLVKSLGFGISVNVCMPSTLKCCIITVQLIGLSQVSFDPLFGTRKMLE